ncbi:MAG: hypothetical protein B7Z37_26460 [Verrucomicrobia bacterium 12-59-8]|nr:MAG: hypothetical protein B7Z37_26460 [Verrucomicrobia bacterium 12-59-8]
MNRPSTHTLIFLAILGLAFTLFLLPLPQGWSAGWRGELTNRLHAPLMGLCFAAWTALLSKAGPPRMRSLLPAATGTAVMAALVEGVQPWFGRTASLEDFLWGMAGILGGCLWLRAGLTRAAVMRHATRLLAVACVLAPPLLWLTQMTLIQAEAHRLFPVLTDSSLPRTHPLLTIEPAHVGSGSEPDALLLARNADHPASLHLDTLDGDWSGFAGLEISGTLQAAAAVEVGVRVDLGDPGTSRLRAGGWMQPGTSQIQIYWTKDAPTTRVHQLVVFLAADSAAARLQIQRLRLIPRQNGAPAAAVPAPEGPPGTKKTLSAGLQGSGIAQ